MQETDLETMPLATASKRAGGLPAAFLALAAAAASSASIIGVAAADADAGGGTHYGPYGYQSSESEFALRTSGDPSSSSQPPSTAAEPSGGGDDDDGPPSPFDADDVYPGAMEYDAESGLLFVTGGAYTTYHGANDETVTKDCDCFLAVLQVPSGSAGDADGAGGTGTGVFAKKENEQSEIGLPGREGDVFSKKEESEHEKSEIGLPGREGEGGGGIRGRRRLLFRDLRDILLGLRSSRNLAGPIDLDAHWNRLNGFGQPKLPPLDPKTEEYRLLRTLRIGTASHPEACSSLAILDAEPLPKLDMSGKSMMEAARVVVVGHTDEGGYGTGLREAGSASERATGYGFALNVNMELDLHDTDDAGDGEKNKARVSGGRLFHSSKVQYPVAVAVPPLSSAANKENEVMYVAMIDTDDDSANVHYQRAKTSSGGKTPDLTQGVGAYHPYGSSFDVTILKLGIKSDDEIVRDEQQVTRTGGTEYPLKEEMRVLWEQRFATREGEASLHSGVLLADLIYVPRQAGDPGTEDFLLMAGSTRGYGSAFGTETIFAASEVDMTGGDWDGFLTKLSTSTGKQLIESVPNKKAHSIRLQSENGMDDLVRGACVRPDAAGVNVAYVVGTTKENERDDPSEPTGVESAFVAAVDLNSMKVLWRKEFKGGSGVGGDDDKDDAPPAGQHSIIGTGCAVTPDGRAVYLGGTIRNGGILDLGETIGKTASHGGDDIYVLRLDAATGEPLWARQLGTGGDEWLAKGKGGITTDEYGNAVLYGGTRGSLMRWRGEAASSEQQERQLPADVFVTTVTSDGKFLPSRDGPPRTDGIFDSKSLDSNGYPTPTAPAGDNAFRASGQESPNDTPPVTESVLFIVLTSIGGAVVFLAIVGVACRAGIKLTLHGKSAARHTKLNRGEAPAVEHHGVLDGPASAVQTAREDDSTDISSQQQQEHDAAVLDGPVRDSAELS